MKKNLIKKIFTFISIMLLCISIGLNAFAEDEIFSLRDDFDSQANAGPVWYYGMYHHGSATHTAGEWQIFNSYKESWIMWVNTETGYEWGGLGAGNWLAFWNADTAARWVAPKSGNIVISAYDQQPVGTMTGNVDIWGGGSVRIKIMKNNTKIYPTDSEWLTTTKRLTAIPNINATVEAGDKIEFVVNAGEDMSMSGDNMNYWPIITLSPIVATSSSSTSNNNSSSVANQTSSSPSSSNPKTTDNGVLIFSLLISLSFLAIYAIRVKIKSISH
jgi:hypothetical protein